MQSAARPGSSIAERIFGVGARRLPGAIAQLPLISLVVFGMSFLSLTMTRDSGGPPAMWSANAFVLVCLVRSSRRRWPTILIASTIGQAVAMALNSRPTVATGATLCDLLEVIYCASALRYFCGRRIDLSQPRTLMIFGATAVIGPILSA